jgi:hypothetical protein
MHVFDRAEETEKNDKRKREGRRRKEETENLYPER